MPNRFEYIQANLKSNAQQKTQAGLCTRPQLQLTPINNWQLLSVSAPGFLNLRVWKDSSGTTYLGGGFSIGASVPAVVDNVIQAAVLPPGYRPGGTVIVPGFYWDLSALVFVQASISVTAAGNIQLFTGLAPATGDYFSCNGAWVAAS